jgi:HPt (histidine-containing phosphotransfer) domain-containing protein
MDVEAGLKRVGGSEALYIKLLNKYVTGEYFSALAEKIGEGDLEGATGAAHTLKGVSANLSLTAVNEAALAVEQALKNGEDVSALLTELETLSGETDAYILAAI